MPWIAPAAKDPACVSLEAPLQDVADRFGANLGRKTPECSGSIPGLTFLG